MKIDFTKSELFLMLLIVEELVSRCQDSESGLNYPGKNIDIFEALADKLKNYAKITEDKNEDSINR